MKNKLYEQFVEKVKGDLKGVIRFAFAFIEVSSIEEIVKETLNDLQNEQN